MGATSIGRDLGPRVSSALHSGLTADCTSLEIGDYEDAKTKQVYNNLLYQIRPAFGGNIKQFKAYVGNCTFFYFAIYKYAVHNLI